MSAEFGMVSTSQIVTVISFRFCEDRDKRTLRERERGKRKKEKKERKKRKEAARGRRERGRRDNFKSCFPTEHSNVLPSVKALSPKPNFVQKRNTEITEVNDPVFLN